MAGNSQTIRDQTEDFYSDAELLELGCTSVGRRVQVSKRAQFHNFSGSIGDNVRIDDFCILKGNVVIGSFVHISAFCLVGGTKGCVTFEDFSGLAARVSIYTGTDNYSGDNLTNPTVPSAYRDLLIGDVFLGRGAIIGAHSVLLPATSVGAFASVGAMCVVKGEIKTGATMVSAAGKPRVISQKDTDKLHQAADAVLLQWKGEAV